MGLHVTMLVPDVHDRPTGGNVYNRRIASGLESRTSVEMVPWRPEAEPPPALDRPEGTALVVDSLLTQHEAPLRALRAAHPSATLVLLAHYLHCIDPNERDTPAATTERGVLPLFNGVLTTSRYAQRALMDEGVPESRIAVVPPGLDEAYRAPVPDRSGRAPPHLLTVASLQPGKGLLVLVNALGELRDTAWTWTLVGDDTLDPGFAEGLRDRIRESGIGHRGEQIGPTPPAEMQAQYDHADVFVLPSRFETCSMATREAMARGLPVVATDVGGVAGNFGEAPAGRLVPPDQPETLAEALRSLLADPEARKKMGDAGRERSRAFPTWPEAADQLWAALQALPPPTAGGEDGP